MIRRPFIVLATLLLLAGAAAATAADAPREAWVKAKCALCHGLDGSSQTERGKKLHAPDLRAPETQKRSDEALTKAILASHAGCRRSSLRTQ